MKATPILDAAHAKRCWEAKLRIEAILCPTLAAVNLQDFDQLFGVHGLYMTYTFKHAHAYVEGLRIAAAGSQAAITGNEFFNRQKYQDLQNYRISAGPPSNIVPRAAPQTKVKQPKSTPTNKKDDRVDKATATALRESGGCIKQQRGTCKETTDHFLLRDGKPTTTFVKHTSACAGCGVNGHFWINCPSR
jgi:hypothetical protein